MSGTLLFPTAPPSNTPYERWRWDAITGAWVIAPTAPMVPLGGNVTMTGPIEFTGPFTSGLMLVNKDYVDQAVSQLQVFEGAWDVDNNIPDLTLVPVPTSGSYYIASTAGTAPAALPGIGGAAVRAGDMVVWNGTLSQWQIIPGAGMTQAEGDARYLQLAGGTMTGAILLSAAPLATDPVLQAANKGYVDLRVLKAGDSMTGTLGVTGASSIISVGAPTGPAVTGPGQINVESGYFINGIRIFATIDITHTALRALKSGGNLAPSQWYRLTDHATRYIQPYSNALKTSAIEPLLVQAISSSQLAKIAYSPSYPQDIITYDIDDVTCSDNVTARTGYIQRRTDTVNNIDMPNDWRTQLWARFRATAPTYTANATPTRGNFYMSGTTLYLCLRATPAAAITDTTVFHGWVQNNEFLWTGQALRGLIFDTATYAERYTFNSANVTTTQTPAQDLANWPSNIVIASPANRVDAFLNAGLRDGPNNVFHATNAAGRPRNIIAGPGFHSNTFRNNCYNLQFGPGCYGNFFGDSAFNNTLGANCYANFMSNATGTTFGSSCYNNMIASGGVNNNFGNTCYGNIFGSTSSRNWLGPSCYNISSVSNMLDNRIGPNNTNHFLNTNCQYNDIGPTNINMVLDPSFRYNNVVGGISGGYATWSVVHNKRYSANIYVASDGKVYASYFNSAGTMIVVGPI